MFSLLTERVIISNFLEKKFIYHKQIENIFLSSRDSIVRTFQFQAGFE